jgi:UDP-glucose 4-epimerase
MNEERPPSRIAITGIAGYLGRELAATFDVDDTTEHVLGLDVAPYVPPSAKVAFVQRSVEEPFADLFEQHKIDGAIHMAFCVEPMRDRAREERINIQGTKNFLDACAKAKVQTVLVLSSASAYGAREDNPMVLYEGAPLRASPAFPYAHDKIRVEELCYEFARANPEACVIIVRPCTVIGPNIRNMISRLFEGPIVFGARGYDPPVQLIHEDDATRSLFRLFKLRKVGVFNLAGDGAITIGRMAQMAEKRVVRLPLFLLRFIVALAWKMGWKWLSEANPGSLDYAIHPCLISNVKLKTELLFLFKYDALRAMQDYVDDRAERLGHAKAPDDLAVDVDEEDLDELEEEDASLEGSPLPVVAPGPGVPGPENANDPTPVSGQPRTDFGNSPAPPDGAKPAVISAIIPAVATETAPAVAVATETAPAAPATGTAPVVATETPPPVIAAESAPPVKEESKPAVAAESTESKPAS